MAVVEKTVDIIGDERFTAMLLAKTIPDEAAVRYLSSCNGCGKLCVL